MASTVTAKIARWPRSPCICTLVRNAFASTFSGHYKKSGNPGTARLFTIIGPSAAPRSIGRKRRKQLHGNNHDSDARHVHLWVNRRCHAHPPSSPLETLEEMETSMHIIMTV